MVTIHEDGGGAAELALYSRELGRTLRLTADWLPGESVVVHVGAAVGRRQLCCAYGAQEKRVLEIVVNAQASMPQAHGTLAIGPSAIYRLDVGEIQKISAWLAKLP
jgi:hypothetical protein